MVTKVRRNVNMVRLGDVDARGPASDSLPQRARGPSAGGDMAAFSSSDGRARGLPSLRTPKVAAEQRAGATLAIAVGDEKYDQIL